MAKQSSKASVLPVVIAVASIVISIVIYFVTLTSADAFLLHLLGYILTPLVVALCMGWDSIAQRLGVGESPWYEKNPTYSLILRILTAISFIPAIFHIFVIASDIAEKIAGQS
jgi:uncharacterized membrane protein YiaA